MLRRTTIKVKSGKELEVMCPVGPTGFVRLRDVVDPDELIQKGFMQVLTGRRGGYGPGTPTLPVYHHVTKWDRDSGELYYEKYDGQLHAVYVGKGGNARVYVSPRKLVKQVEEAIRFAKD